MRKLYLATICIISLTAFMGVSLLSLGQTPALSTQSPSATFN